MAESRVCVPPPRPWHLLCEGVSFTDVISTVSGERRPCPCLASQRTLRTLASVEQMGSGLACRAGGSVQSLRREVQAQRAPGAPMLSPSAVCAFVFPEFAFFLGLPVLSGVSAGLLCARSPPPLPGLLIAPRCPGLRSLVPAAWLHAAHAAAAAPSSEPSRAAFKALPAEGVRSPGAWPPGPLLPGCGWLLLHCPQGWTCASRPGLLELPHGPWGPPHRCFGRGLQLCHRAWTV